MKLHAYNGNMYVKVGYMYLVVLYLEQQHKVRMYVCSVVCPPPPPPSLALCTSDALTSQHTVLQTSSGYPLGPCGPGWGAHSHSTHLSPSWLLPRHPAAVLLSLPLSLCGLVACMRAGPQWSGYGG